VPVPRGQDESVAVLKLDDDPLQVLVGLQGHVLGVLVTDAAELAAELGFVQRSTAEAAGRIGLIARHWDDHFNIAAPPCAL
jgi:hypothetical protein